VTTMGGSGFSGLGPLSVSEEGSVSKRDGGIASKRDGGIALLSTENEVCLEWLAHALQQLRQEGQTQTKVVSYLEAVSEEVVFEMKALPRS
jgi:hypothetical protein